MVKVSDEEMSDLCTKSIDDGGSSCNSGQCQEFWSSDMLSWLYLLAFKQLGFLTMEATRRRHVHLPKHQSGSQHTPFNPPPSVCSH